MIEHEYFGKIDDNYNEFGGQTTSINDTSLHGNAVKCQLYIDASVTQSSLDALAHQHQHLEELDKKSRQALTRSMQANQSFIADYLSNIEAYDSDKIAEFETCYENGKAVTSAQFVSALQLDSLWLSSAADDEIYCYEPGILESNIDDKAIHIHLSYDIDNTMGAFVLLVHFNLQGEFVKVTYGQEY